MGNLSVRAEKSALSFFIHFNSDSRLLGTNFRRRCFPESVLDIDLRVWYTTGRKAREVSS